jgi:hypothetical protein
MNYIPFLFCVGLIEKASHDYFLYMHGGFAKIVLYTKLLRIHVWE